VLVRNNKKFKANLLNLLRSVYAKRTA